MVPVTFLSFKENVVNLCLLLQRCSGSFLAWVVFGRLCMVSHLKSTVTFPLYVVRSRNHVRWFFSNSFSSYVLSPFVFLLRWSLVSIYSSVSMFLPFRRDNMFRDMKLLQARLSTSSARSTSCIVFASSWQSSPLGRPCVCSAVICRVREQSL